MNLPQYVLVENWEDVSLAQKNQEELEFASIPWSWASKYGTGGTTPRVNYWMIKAKPLVYPTEGDGGFRPPLLLSLLRTQVREVNTDSVNGVVIFVLFLFLEEPDMEEFFRLNMLILSHTFAIGRETEKNLLWILVHIFFQHTLHIRICFDVTQDYWGQNSIDTEFRPILFFSLVWD
ncbi:hypothetical protein ACJX0J_033641 [Zea mays]